MLYYVLVVQVCGVSVLYACMGIGRGALDRTAQCGTWHRWAWHAKCVCCGYFKMLCSCSVSACYFYMDGVGTSGSPFASLTVPTGSVAVVMVCCVVRLSAQLLVVSLGPMG